MKLVRARASDYVRRRAQGIPEFGIGIVSQNFEFCDGVERRLKNKASVHSVEIVCAVDQKIVRLRPLADRARGSRGGEHRADRGADRRR